MTQKHLIEVENGKKVAAAHHEADSDRWIFFCHGFGSNKDGYDERCERAAAEGWNGVRFDFRGNGESDGEFIDQNLSSKIEDLKAVIDHFGPERYVLWGMSFGGKVVLHAAEETDPLGLILKSPVTWNKIMDKYRGVVEIKGEFTYFDDKTINESFYDDLDEYDFRETAESLEVPVMFFHGNDDTTVHPEHTLRAAEVIDTDITVHKMEGETHFYSDDANEFLLDEMFHWLRRI